MKNMATDKAVYKPAGTSDYREEDKRKSLWLCIASAFFL
jgi:hypothetical protein